LFSFFILFAFFCFHIFFFSFFPLHLFDEHRYTGFSNTTMRDISYTSTYFFCYEPLKQLIASAISGGKNDKNSNNNHGMAKTGDSESGAGFSWLPVVLSGGTSGMLILV
jgi:hypothetical protein